MYQTRSPTSISSPTCASGLCHTTDRRSRTRAPVAGTNQLANATAPFDSSECKIDSLFDGTRQATSELLSSLADERKLALLDDTKLAPKRFILALPHEMRIKRGRGQGIFIESVSNILKTFYGEVAQEITPWTPKTPRLPDSHHDQQSDPEREPNLAEAAEIGTHLTEVSPVPSVNTSRLAHARITRALSLYTKPAAAYPPATSDGTTTPRRARITETYSTASSPATASQL